MDEGEKRRWYRVYGGQCREFDGSVVSWILDRWGLKVAYVKARRLKVSFQGFLNGLPSRLALGLMVEKMIGDDRA